MFFTFCVALFSVFAAKRCRRSDIQPLMHEMTEPIAAKKSTGEFQKFGSKLGAIVELLKEIKCKDHSVLLADVGIHLSSSNNFCMLTIDS